ncbi:IS66-like element accessory protein TnpA [Paracoccus fontiphilus]|uniref:IS66-like element accessory protein TnpA n=1 Tax=Paracoccus fontiphilus TaxID=1815556 RepID=UPI0031019099
MFAADDVGRRRQWSDEDKVRIVEESLLGYRQGSATARRNGLSRSLLSIWRREYRHRTLGCTDVGEGFVPLVIEGTESEPTDMRPQGSGDNRIDITLTKGRSMTIPAPPAPSHLAALLTVLDPQ